MNMNEFFDAIEKHQGAALCVAVVLLLLVEAIASAFKNKK
jgi:type II secretory pathway component PulK